MTERARRQFRKSVPSPPSIGAALPWVRWNCEGEALPTHPRDGGCDRRLARQTSSTAGACARARFENSPSPTARRGPHGREARASSAAEGEKNLEKIIQVQLFRRTVAERSPF